MLPTVAPIEEWLERGLPDLVLETEAQTTLLPQQADVSAVGQMGEEKAWEEPSLTSDAATLD
jgi:hypothetical protein